MADEPRIAVAGHLVADEIIHPDGTRISALGGISYNLAALLAVMRGGTVLPVCEIGFDIEDLFEDQFGRCDSLDTSAIRRTSLPNVVNRLVYDHNGNREEWNSRIPEILSLDGIGEDIDAVLMNFISGDDFSLEELNRFREKYKGVMFCDFHSLALGRDSEGKRYFRKHPEWDGFLAQMDIVQMNIAELATISGADELSFGNIIAVTSLIHSLRPDICIITLGRNGAVLSTGRGRAVYHIPPVKVEEEIDPTGCGDAFAAVFLYNFLISRDPVAAALTANRYAASKAGFTGLDGFAGIGDVVENIGTSIEPVKIK